MKYCYYIYEHSICGKQETVTEKNTLNVFMRQSMVNIIIANSKKVKSKRTQTT